MIHIKMVWPAMLSFVYPPPPSVFMTVMAVISTAGVANAGLSEIWGAHLKYSKFWNVTSPKREAQVSSQTGMLVLYVPAFLTGAASFWVFPAGDDGGLRFLLLRSALTLHFLKRVLEVKTKKEAKSRIFFLFYPPISSTVSPLLDIVRIEI